MTKKILVIDYDQRGTTRLADLLKSHGFEVVIANDGQAGWDAFRQTSPDLVIMEPMLSKIHGFELCQKIRSATSGRTQVIILTGIYKDTIYKTEALKTYGAFQYFEKPVDDNKLMEEVRRALHVGGPKAEVRGQAPDAPAKAPQAVPTVQPVKAKEEARTAASIGRERSIEEILGHALNTGPEPAKKPARKEQADSEGIDELLKNALKGLDVVKVKSYPAPKPAQTAPETKEPAKAETSRADHPKAWTAPAGERSAETRGSVPPVKKEGTPPAPVRIPFEKADPLRKIRKEAGTERAASGSPEKSETHPPSDLESFGGLAGGTPGRRITPLMAAACGTVILIVIGLLSIRPGASSRKTAAPADKVRTVENAPAENQAADSQAVPPAETQPQTKVQGKAPKPEPKKTATAKPEKKAAAAQPAQAAPDAGLQPILQAQPAAQQAAGTISGDKQAAKPADDKSTAPAQQTVQPAVQPQNQPQTAEPAKQEGGQPAAKTAGAGEAQAQPAAEPARNAAEPTVLPGQLVDLTEVERQPSVVKRVKPSYPDLARKNKVEGVVTVNALVNEFGNVIDTRILRGIKDDRGLHKAAEDAVRKWKFNAAFIGKVPVKVWFPVVIVFKAEQ